MQRGVVQSKREGKGKVQSLTHDGGRPRRQPKKAASSSRMAAGGAFRRGLPISDALGWQLHAGRWDVDVVRECVMDRQVEHKARGVGMEVTGCSIASK